MRYWVVHRSRRIIFLAREWVFNAPTPRTLTSLGAKVALATGYLPFIAITMVTVGYWIDMPEGPSTFVRATALGTVWAVGLGYLMLGYWVKAILMMLLAIAVVVRATSLIISFMFGSGGSALEFLILIFLYCALAIEGAVGTTRASVRALRKNGG